MRRPRPHRPHRPQRVARELWEQVCVHLLTRRVCTTRGKLLTIQLYSEKSLLRASPAGVLATTHVSLRLSRPSARAQEAASGRSSGSGRCLIGLDERGSCCGARVPQCPCRLGHSALAVRAALGGRGERPADIHRTLVVSPWVSGGSSAEPLSGAGTGERRSRPHASTPLPTPAQAAGPLRVPFPALLVPVVHFRPLKSQGFPCCPGPPLPTRREQRSRWPGGCGPVAHRAPDGGAAGRRGPGQAARVTPQGLAVGARLAGGRAVEGGAASTPGREERVPRLLCRGGLTSSGSCGGFPPCLLGARGPRGRSAGHAGFLGSMLSCSGGTPGLHQALHTETSVLPWKAQSHLCWGRQARQWLCRAPFSPQMRTACRTPRMPQPQPPGPPRTRGGRCSQPHDAAPKSWRACLRPLDRCPAARRYEAQPLIFYLLKSGQVPGLRTMKVSPTGGFLSIHQEVGGSACCQDNLGSCVSPPCWSPQPL